MRRPLACLAALILVVGCDDGDETPPLPDPAAVAFSPAPATLRRLTADQYRAVVRDLLGDDIVLPGRLEPDTRAGGSLALGATITSVSERGVEMYGDGAYVLAAQAISLERRARLADCDVADDACLRQTLTDFGRRAWRRPLTADEVDRLAGVARTTAETLGDAWAGLEFALAGILQSPHFVYRVELGAAPGPTPGTEVLDAYGVASRLSFFLWNTAPDDALLDAAAAGRLDDAAGLRAEAERMMADDRVRDGVRAFFDDLLQLDRLGDLTKAAELFPHYDDAVGASAREETLAVLERLIVDERGDYRDVMTSRRTIVDRKLASIYNVRAPAREGFGPVELPSDSQRVGLLGHVSSLALHSHPVSTSATLRGMFVRETLLCQTIPDPPSGVDTSIPEPSGEAPTLRDRIAEHLESPACRGCHLITDPIGLGLEHFDGLGRERLSDGGAHIDASGELDGVPFAGPEELAEAIRNHDDFAPCLVKKLYRYAVGHELEREDAALVDALSVRFAARNHDVLTLMLDIIESPAFRQSGAEEVQ